MRFHVVSTIGEVLEAALEREVHALAA